MERDLSMEDISKLEKSDVDRLSALVIKPRSSSLTPTSAEPTSRRSLFATILHDFLAISSPEISEDEEELEVFEDRNPIKGFVLFNCSNQPHHL